MCEIVPTARFLKIQKKNKILGFPKDFVAELVSPPGLEPGASGLGGSRSIQLSYGDI